MNEYYLGLAIAIIILCFSLIKFAFIKLKHKNILESKIIDIHSKKYYRVKKEVFKNITKYRTCRHCFNG